MASLSNQIKAKLQSIGSPKLKFGGQSPLNTNFQRVPTVGKINVRDANTSQSPDDNTGSRGGATAIQRIQMKNVAFIPAKGQSPSSQNLQFSSCVPNLTNFNTSTSQNQNDQQSKVSPQRLITTNGNKMIIPANQIKLVKKDGASPSPDARIPQKQQQQTGLLTNQQNMNPNMMIMPGGNTQQIKLSNAAGPKQQSRISNNNNNCNNTKISQQHLSDDETTVMSDSEDKVQNLTSMKQDPSQNNFNRPKLNTNNQQSQSQLTDNIQKTQRDGGNEQQQRIKIISQHKIRQSPSPPPNQVLKFQQPPSVTNIQIQIKQQQQTTQPQLATDFIKGMINQSRTNNILNNGGNTLQKKIGGITNGLKIKNENINQQQNFIKDMKKHGMTKDIQDVSSLNQILSENSPVRQDDSQVANQQPSTTNSHHRNYSPPPNFCQAGPTNISKIQTKESIVKDHHQKAIIQNNNNQEQPSPTNVSNQGDTSNVQQQQEGGASVFQFPFQRRARSLSLPKQDIIQSKLGQKQQQQQQIPPSQHQHHPQQQNKSPSPNNEESRRNGPVVAKINFVIAQKGALGQQNKQVDEAVFERNKEVDEWLMGSGESDATAGSNNNSIPLAVIQQVVKGKQSELEKPIQPGKQNEGDDDNSLDGEDEEDWMFKTFNGLKKGQKNVVQSQRQNVIQQATVNNTTVPGRSRLNEKTFEEALEEESPFDMAPEMSKVIPKKGQFMFDDMGQDCNDISQYMEQIDQFMEKIY